MLSWLDRNTLQICLWPPPKTYILPCDTTAAQFVLTVLMLGAGVHLFTIVGALVGEMHWAFEIAVYIGFVGI